MSIRFAFCLLFCAASPVMADVEVHFTEGTPKDNFTLTNAGCDLPQTQVVLDMSGSYGGLEFDTKGTGGDSDPAQPFEVVSGAIANVVVEDGGNQLRFTLPQWPKDTEVSFTIDIDDVLRHGDRGRTLVSGGEIAGTELRISSEIASGFGVFDNAGRTTLRRLCGA